MTEIAQIKAEMQDVVENNILSFWFAKQTRDASSMHVSFGVFRPPIAYSASLTI